MDWKTSVKKTPELRDDEVLQLKIYALYVFERYGINNILCRIENLVSGSYQEISFDAKSFHQEVEGPVRNYIVSQMDNMAKMVVDGDLAKNEVLDKENFNQSTKLCKYCKFKAICERKGD